MHFLKDTLKLSTNVFCCDDHDHRSHWSYWSCIDQIMGRFKAHLVLHLETLSCRSFSSSFPLPLPASLLTISSWSRDLEQKMSTLTRMWVQFDIFLKTFICILSFQTIHLYLIMLPLTCNFEVFFMFRFQFLFSYFCFFLLIFSFFHSTSILSFIFSLWVLPFLPSF